MSYDTELAALLSEPWNESVCRGYTILALERCGYKTAVIQRVMSELHELLDFTSPQEARHTTSKVRISFLCPLIRRKATTRKGVVALRVLA